jgi:hypothetical protein
MVDSPKLIFPVVGLSSHCGGQYNKTSWRVRETHKVDLDISNSTAPAIETEDLVGKIDDLFCSKIVDFASSVSRTCRDVFGTKLLVETTLQRSYLLCRVFIDVVLLLLVRVSELVVLPLITRSTLLLAASLS